VRRSLAVLVCLGAAMPALPASQSAARGSWTERLRQIVQAEAEDKGFPSFSVIVTGPDGPIASALYGRTARTGGAAVAPESLYRTGSVGKTLTDLAVMIAVERGLVDLDADVRRYLPSFAPQSSFAAPITLRRLMMHRAGLVREPPIGHYYDDSSPTLEATVQSLNDTILLWEPGTRTKYSNAGLAVVGRVLEQVFHRPYADLMSKIVFGPTGMRTAQVGLPPGRADRLARGVMWRPDRPDVWDAPLFNLGMSPAGDLYASTNDMAAFLRSLLSTTTPVLPRRTLDLMWSPYPARARWQLDVGLGFSLNGTFDGRYWLARNGGAVYGYSTELALLPEEGVGVYAVAARDSSNGTVQAVAHWALRALMAEREGRTMPPYDLSPRPFAGLAAELADCSRQPTGTGLARYAGRYGLADGPIDICVQDNRLVAVVEWFSRYPLTERGAGVFDFPSWALYGEEQLRFEEGSEGPGAIVLGRGRVGVRLERLRPSAR